MSGAPSWSRRVAARARTLRALLRDTQRALHDVADILTNEAEVSSTVLQLSYVAGRPTALVLLGDVTRLLHAILARRVLPDRLPRQRKWIRVTYGVSTQVHLTLGNSEFELVEPLVCHAAPWDVLPHQDLLRTDPNDLSTILEVQLNHQLLKDGLQIIIPPDIVTETDSSASFQQLKTKHSELYAKRTLILKTFNPIYLYGLSKIGKNVFSGNFCEGKICSSRSEEDFWSTFNLYYMTRSKCDSDLSDKCSESVDNVRFKGGHVRRNSDPFVFNAENCLDLHQIKELNPNAQVQFILFSDSVDIKESKRRKEESMFSVEATESAKDFTTEELPESDQNYGHNKKACSPKQESPKKSQQEKQRLYEEQCAFMNDTLDQWELMSSPPSKHSVRSQWLIIDDKEIISTIDQKKLASYLSVALQSANETSLKGKKNGDGELIIKNGVVFLNKIVKFASDCWQTYLLEFSTKLGEIHVKLLQQFILASFDLARELQVVPKKIQYVAKQEQQLYESIHEKFSEGDKKQELLQIMQEVLQEMRDEIKSMDWSVDDLPCHRDHQFIISNSTFYESSRASSERAIQLSNRNDVQSNMATETKIADDRNMADCDEQFRMESNGNIEAAKDSTVSGRNDNSDIEEAESYDSYNFDDYEIIHSNDESLAMSDCFQNRIDRLNLDDTASCEGSQIGLIHVENESSLFTVNSSIFRSTVNRSLGYRCTNTQISIKQASLDVQQTVLNKLSRKISLKLANFVDCLKDTYFGTLQRCLDQLECSCRQELPTRPASAAVRQLLAASRGVSLRPADGLSLLQGLLDTVRRIFHRLRLVGGATDACCPLAASWRRQMALHSLHSLSVRRLARVISAQILERLSSAHEKYQSALASLESALATRLHHTEDIKLTIRKKYAPGFARLCLESTSMCDLLMYGSPELGREIGRGQYGVVYAVKGSWAGASPVAAKSVLPQDDRHYQELAMEFFYTRSIPPHPRIVRLVGSVVPRAGPSRAVLLVSPRYARDLHAHIQLRSSLDDRLQIARDIVEGIRYLHSLGLVHRDIKLKNVLLNPDGGGRHRAALTDLGFCAAEALMSGSVVGTPVHMAPELLNGDYDASVDVYAFGILFWYICAGSVKLPAAFEAFQNKEQLWSKVRKGRRPERLPHFTDECWDIMTSCWASEPSQRALLGDIQPKLDDMLKNCLSGQQADCLPEADSPCDSDDSLEFTGLDKREL